MTGWLRAVRRELAHGACRVALVGMAAMVGVLLWSAGADWGARWNSLGSTLREMVIVLGPACLVLGLWQGGRDHRAGLEELLGSTRRERLARASSEVAALSMAAYAGVLLGWASAAWSIVAVGGWGSWAAVGYLVGLLPTVVAWVAVGHLLGRWLTWRVAAPLAGVVAYLLFALLVYDSSNGEALTGAGWLGGEDGYAFASPGLLWTSGILVATATAFTALGGVDHRPGASRTWAAPVLAGLLAVGLLAQPAWAAAGDAARTEAAPALACTRDARPQVCVLAEDHHLLGLATRQARPILRRLASVPGAPRRAGPTVGRLADPAVLQVDHADTTPFGHPDESYGPAVVAHPDYALSLYHGGCPERVARREPRGVLDEADHAVAPGGPHVRDPRTAVLRRRLAASSRTEVDDFLGRLVAARRACDPAAQRAAVDALAPDPGR